MSMVISALDAFQPVRQDVHGHFWPVDTVFVCLDAHCAWAINQEKPEILPSSVSRPKRWIVTSGGDQRYYTRSRKLSIHIGALENMISVSFWANISEILLELPWKMLRFALYMGSDRYKRLVLAISLVFLPPNTKFTYYHSPRKWGVRGYSSMHIYSNEYGRCRYSA